MLVLCCILLCCAVLYCAVFCQGALAQARFALKPDGLFLGAMLGGQTLQVRTYLRLLCSFGWFVVGWFLVCVVGWVLVYSCCRYAICMAGKAL